MEAKVFDVSKPYQINGSVYDIGEKKVFMSGNVEMTVQDLTVCVPNGRTNEFFFVEFYNQRTAFLEKLRKEQKVSVIVQFKGRLSKTGKSFNGIEGMGVNV